MGATMGRAADESGSVLRRFLGSEAAGGIILMAAAALALLAANGPLSHFYHALLDWRLGPMTVHHWINDGLMAVFFLLVGLELKREFGDGGLSTPEQRRLPLAAAAAGMAVPALIYLLAAGSDPILARGWAIPAATDIAFAVGVLALLGTRVPGSLRLFLLTVAIADDLGAVMIIALAYTAAIDFYALAAAAMAFGGMILLNRIGVRALWPYLLGFLLLWVAVMGSGVHPTIAGVLAAMTVPVAKGSEAGSPLHRLEHALAPAVAFLVVPLFGFANAGVSLAGLSLERLLAPLPLGVAAGLFLGKQAGIFGAVRLAVRFGLAARPGGATWLQLYGIALLCGIGFTMSLFIGALAFAGDPARVEEAKLGILAGSLASALAGYLVLRLAPRAPDPQEEARFAGGQAETMETPR